MEPSPALGGLTKNGTGTVTLSATNTYGGATTVNAGVLRFDTIDSVGGAGASVTVNSTGTAAAGFAIDQTFLGRIDLASAGVIALAVDSGNALDMTGFTTARLGAVGAATLSGTLTPNGTYLPPGRRRRDAHDLEHPGRQRRAHQCGRWTERHLRPAASS